jgi:hypothetical protein
MTEDGWDRLAATEVGFTGSVLNGAKSWEPDRVRWGAESRGNAAFGAGNWEPYPLGVWLFHDKVLFYHHDLSHPTMNAGLEVLTWNCAFGVMAGYLWPELRGLNADWISIVNAFQPAVLSRLAGQTLTAYRKVGPEVTESGFGDISAIANWNASATYSSDGYTIAPSGCLIRSRDGNLVAGTFVQSLSGEPLSDGTHFLIFERKAEGWNIRQPVGTDTRVRLPGDTELAAYQVSAVARDGRVLGSWNAIVHGSRFSFDYKRQVSGATVDHYELQPLGH